MKKVLYISSILTFGVFLYFIGIYIYYFCNFQNVDSYNSVDKIFFFMFFLGTILYLILYVIHFAFPQNYKDKYLRTVFVIDYIGLIINLIVCIVLSTSTIYWNAYISRPFPILLSCFIFMSIMGYVGFIHKKKNKNIESKEDNNIVEEDNK